MYPIYLLLNICSFLLIGSDFQTSTKDSYRCMPCGRDCDTPLYSVPGNCSSCHMTLVKASTIYFKNTAPNQICDYLQKHPTTIVLDVRTKDEFEGKADPNFGSLKKAINIPVQQLTASTASIAQYKNKEILVYCSHGHRSEQAAYLLNQAGFSKVTNMLGGMSMVTSKSCKN